jgi:septal ring factor EnvC (AmiA/AmiB activator)
MLDPAESGKWNSLERRVERLEEDMADVKASLRNIETKVDRLVEAVAEIRGSIIGIEGRLDGINGRISGMDSHIAALPTTWTILGIVFTTWALGSGILIFAMNFLQR